MDAWIFLEIHDIQYDDSKSKLQDLRFGLHLVKILYPEPLA